jgi:predicted methyltransferase
MHQHAFQWVAAHVPAEPGYVLEIGGRNINGGVRDLFAAATGYVALDIIAGEGVDIVADASTWTPDRVYDTVVCCEVFEHTDVWPEIVGTAFAALRPGGVFIATMAGPGRAPHSAFDGGPLQAGEYYSNVNPDELKANLKAAGFKRVVVNELQSAGDVRCVAVR